MRRELLMGCGSRLNKDLYLEGAKEFEDVVTLDNNEDHYPEIVWDLTKHPLPFKNNEFDEIHAYEVLEHLAYQGDYEFFFAEFMEYYRILKPGGHFFATVPEEKSKWAWGDPSHRRVITPSNLAFLNWDFYKQVGTTKASDFRYIYKANFKVVHQKTENETFSFVLRKEKVPYWRDNEDSSTSSDV